MIVRCSQPEVGWLYWRCEDDEIYLQTLGNVVDSTKHVQNGEELSGGSDSSDDACNSDENMPHTNGLSGRPAKGQFIWTICAKILLNKGYHSEVIYI